MKKRRLHRLPNPANMHPIEAAISVAVTPPIVTVIEYSAQNFSEKTLTLAEVYDFKPAKNCKLWLNVHGLHDVDLINKIGEKFKLHPLVVEDIFNTTQRPKLDAFEDYLFLEANYFYYESADSSISAEQISVVLNRDFLLTFQERSTGIFEPIRERLRKSQSQMRGLGVDYLAYAILDTVVDSYFGVLDSMADDCEALEDSLLASPTNKELQHLHQLKRTSMELRRSVWPLREVINHLTRNENSFLAAQTLPYMRDVYDHTVHFIESLEAQRDMLGGMMDIYLSSVSQRVNLELRALTVVAMLFMPATLIAGIFGMNFHWMPWIDDKNGFWWALMIMGGIALLMILVFWRRQWINRNTFSINRNDD